MLLSQDLGSWPREARLRWLAACGRLVLEDTPRSDIPARALAEVRAYYLDRYEPYPTEVGFVVEDLEVGCRAQAACPCGRVLQLDLADSMLHRLAELGDLEEEACP